MSRVATDWAWSLDLKAPQKILVLSLADRADEYHCCYPSIQRLVADTGLDKKTIGKWINQMIEIGLIFDTGERKGPTKRVRVLRLNIEFKCTQKRVDLTAGNDPKNGNIPKNGNVPEIGCLNDPKFGCLNDPKFGSLNQSLEPNIESKDPPLPPRGKSGVNKFNPLDVDLPDWLPPEIWREWVEFRKQLRKPVKTPRGVAESLKRLDEFRSQGFSPEQVIRQSIANEWQGLFAPKDYAKGGRARGQGNFGAISPPEKTIPDGFTGYLP